MKGDNTDWPKKGQIGLSAGMRWHYRYYDIETILLNYQNKVLIPTCRLSVHKIIGKHEILQTYDKSEFFIFYPVVFCKF